MSEPKAATCPRCGEPCLLYTGFTSIAHEIYACKCVPTDGLYPSCWTIPEDELERMGITTITSEQQSAANSSEQANNKECPEDQKPV